MYKPDRTEYPDYYHTYISEIIESEDIIPILEEQQKTTNDLLKGITNEQSLGRYKEGKWSIREITGHLADTEKIMATRALRIARNDQTPQPGFSEDDYVKNANFDNIKFGDLINVLYFNRSASIALFKTFNEEELLRKGIANGKEVSARALMYIIAGHEKHHIDFMKSNYSIEPVESE